MDLRDSRLVPTRQTLFSDLNTKPAICFETDITAKYNADTQRDACPVAASHPSFLSLSRVLDQVRDELQTPGSPPKPQPHSQVYSKRNESV